VIEDFFSSVVTNDLNLMAQVCEFYDGSPFMDREDGVGVG
jgi:hypothetical protein